MLSERPVSVVATARPVHPMLVAAPVVCFVGALLTDIAYAATADILWSDFSDWLLAAGMALGVISFVVAIVTVIADRRVRAGRLVWPFILVSVLMLAVGFLDNLVHSRDAWTSVVPQGLILSVVTVLLGVTTGWLAAREQAPTARPLEIR